MRAKVDPKRSYYLRQVEEPTHFATTIEIGKGSVGREVVVNGLSRHFVNAASMIHDAEECDKEISMADGESLKITSVGSVRSQVVADGEERTVTLTDVYLEAQLAHNINVHELPEQGQRYPRKRCEEK
ncbi:hypothetical protein ABG067_003124 [Albugo candida]